MHTIEREWLDAQDEAYARWESANADRLCEEAYEAWASDRRDDGEDDSRDAYDEYIDARLPDWA